MKKIELRPHYSKKAEINRRKVIKLKNFMTIYLIKGEMRLKSNSFQLSLVVSFLTIVIVLCFTNTHLVYEPPFLLPILNTIFLALIPFIVAYTMARLFINCGQVAMLMLGCGMMTIGLGAITSGWLIGMEGGPNRTVTIYNTGVLFCAVFHVVAFVFLLKPIIISQQKKRNYALIGTYLSVSILMCSFIITVIKDRTPLYFIQGTGPTLLNRVVLGLAIIIFGISSVLGSVEYSGTRPKLVVWYATGNALLAIGLFGVFMQKSVGSPIGWIGRIAQYTGELCILFGVLQFWRRKIQSGLSLVETLDVAIKEAKTNYQDLIETAPYGIISVDDKGRILLWNKAAQKLFGYSDKEVVGKYLKDRVVFENIEGADGPEFDFYLSDSYTYSKDFSPHTLELHARIEKDKLLPVEISVSKSMALTGPIMTIIVNNIATRKAAEKALKELNNELEERVLERTCQLEHINTTLTYTNSVLEKEIELRIKVEGDLKESELQFRNAIDEAPIPIMLLSEEGRIIKVNNAWKNITGYTIDEIPTVSDWIHKAYETECKKSLNANTSLNCFDTETFKGEVKIITKNGNIIIWDLHSAFIGKLVDGFRIAIIVPIDVTERKKTNEKLIQERDVAEASSIAKSQLFATMSHEFRTPINVMLSAIQLFELYIKNGDDLETGKTMKHLKSMKQSSLRLLRLVNNLIDISKIDSGFYEPSFCNYNIVEVIERIISSVRDYAKQKNIKIRFKSDMKVIIVKCDIDMIERIMLNLISNSIKYSNENCLIQISITHDSDKLAISIKDNGIGIAKENQLMIFERYKQVSTTLSRKSEGSGIGLSLVKSMVELHNGTISLSSEYEKGSEFIVEIPNVRYESEDTIPNRLADKLDAQQTILKMNVEFSDIYF